MKPAQASALAETQRLTTKSAVVRERLMTWLPWKT